ncbi:MAG: serine/threonine-protein kinase [Gemmatimonadota bacterium]
MPLWLDHLADELSDRYRLDRELGQGGMAAVYLAHDLRHHRSVAIKVLRPECAIALGAERFLREIEIAAPLMHPHIVSLLDSGAAAGTMFYVMPYLSGDSLRARLTNHGELAVADTIRIMRGVFSALAYAHAQGIVHRDIKPENVLLAGDHAQVADFGIARGIVTATGASRLTGTGFAIGTTAYMAPEQAAGDPKLDHRADLYSAGLLWYELLAGRHPFADLSPQQQFAAHFTRDIVPLDALRPSIPAALSALVARCIEKRPADRWQQATDVLGELDALLTSGSARQAVRSYSEPSLRSFRLRESLLDELSAPYDPRMSGDSIQYLDNGKISDVLVCYFNRWSMDPEGGAALLRQTEYRAIAPALFGFESTRRYRAALPLEDHLRLVGGLLNDLITTTEPTLVLLMGFSAGADLALRFAGMNNGVARGIDAVVAVSPNLVIESAFASAVLAKMTVAREDEVLPYLRRVVDAQETLQEWADVSEYLARLARRFRNDFHVLQQFANDIASPLERGARFETFAGWYRACAERTTAVRCVFEDTALCRQLVSELQQAQKERRLLGPHHRSGTLIIEPGTGHFDLEDATLLDGHLRAVVAETRRRT